jgi:TorA maturation chaperone TorD
MSDAGPASADSALDPEELARASLYALVSRLFYAPADPNLLAEVSRGDPGAETAEQGGALFEAWRALRAAAGNAFPALVRQEYDTLFVGVGRAEVSPYLSGYAEPASPEIYLVRLKEQLGAWGLARREQAFEVEDHISGLSDAMRWLIENRYSLAQQHAFFTEYLYPGAKPFYAAVQNAVSANFYKAVASFAADFLEVEKAAFDMTDLS